MFDWARGSALRRFIDLGLFMAGWDPAHARWLKNWHTPWLLGLVNFTPEMSVLDVGSSHPWFMKWLHQNHGCEVHALDVDSSRATNDNFGFAADVDQIFSPVTMHVGLVGDEVLPTERFDVITCISMLEHTYDTVSPLSPQKPLAHLNALRDMSRMLKPGGVLLMNWDMYLHGVNHHIGWDYEVDIWILQACGMQLACDRRILRGAQYLVDHPDTVFFDHEDVLQFNVETVARGTAINTLWRKPGDADLVPVTPRRDLEDIYFPLEETRQARQDAIGPRVTTDEIDQRFRNIISRVTDVLRRSDSSGRVGGRGRRGSYMRSFWPFGFDRR
jgi:SAM-dependent methyltransferase